MRKLLILSAPLLAFLAVPALSQTIVVKPEVDTWVMEQPDTSVTFDGDVVVGTALPDTVHVIAVPNSDEYSYVVVNKKRVLVDRKTRKVIKVY